MQYYNSPSHNHKPQPFYHRWNRGYIHFATISTFANYDDISVGGNQAFSIKSGGYITHFINHGNIDQNNKMSFYVDGGKGISNLTNYGTMGAIDYSGGSETMTLNNFGVIKASGDGWHINAKNNILIANYALNINENTMTFNAFSGSSSSAHLVISGSGVSFKDGDSKIILDFGNDFEFGEKYLISKLATDTSGGAYSDLGVNFSHITKSDIYLITQSGDNFVVNFAPQYGAVGSLYKSNIRTMNNFITMSNSMIYPYK